MGDLIDHNTRSWKVDLVRSPYPFPQALKILQIPISKANFVPDKLLWRFSKNGDYQVKKAYELLTRDASIHSRYLQANMGWWRTFWKIKVPLKISTFIWKLLHNCLPTLLNLHARGISSTKSCPLCNEEEESHTHLVLHCPFARAYWHGSIPAIHTSEFTNISVQLWLKQLLSRNIQSDSDSMNFLQDVFVILWTIWTYRNRVVHQGLNLNPVEVILTTQTFSYRYRDTLSRCSTSADRAGRCARLEGQSAAGDWHLIIKLAGARSRRPYRYGTAYEALTIQGDRVFFGVNSSNARTSIGALLEAVVEAGLAAQDQGFHHVLVLTDSENLMQTFKMKTTSDWLDNTRLADLSFLSQSGFHCDVICVPHAVVKESWSVAKLATYVPIHFCWFSPVGADVL